MKAIVREPLLHFLLLGAFVFWLNARIAGPALQRDDVVEVNAGQIDRLRQTWMMQWRRPPTERELRGLIDAHIREEILYREALAMGLDRDDTIVRRRLAQKMEFLSEDTANLAEPEGGELEAFFEENAERYEAPTAISFSHIYFSVDRRGAEAVSDAEATAVILRGEAPPRERAAELGDRFMLQSQYSQLDRREIGELFGGGFAETLMEQPVGQWVGPLESGYGIHLVYLSERIEASAPPLAAVRDRVESDWRGAMRDEANQAYFDRLRRRYRVELDEQALEAALGGGAPREADSEPGS